MLFLTSFGIDDCILSNLPYYAISIEFFKYQSNVKSTSNSKHFKFQMEHMFEEDSHMCEKNTYNHNCVGQFYGRENYI